MTSTATASSSSRSRRTVPASDKAVGRLGIDQARRPLLCAARAGGERGPRGHNARLLGYDPGGFLVSPPRLPASPLSVIVGPGVAKSQGAGAAEGKRVLPARQPISEGAPPVIRNTTLHPGLIAGLLSRRPAFGPRTFFGKNEKKISAKLSNHVGPAQFRYSRFCLDLHPPKGFEKTAEFCGKSNQSRQSNEFQETPFLGDNT